MSDILDRREDSFVLQGSSEIEFAPTNGVGRMMDNCGEEEDEENEEEDEVDSGKEEENEEEDEEGEGSGEEEEELKGIQGVNIDGSLSSERGAGLARDVEFLDSAICWKAGSL